MRTVCFVTNELYPISAGGIGRLVYNFCKHTNQVRSDIDIHLLVSHIPVESLDEANEALKGLATLHSYPSIRSRPDQLSRLFAAKRLDRWDFSEHYEKSLQTMLSLSQLEAELGRNLDIVEFPDFSGFGVASIAAKQVGLMFEKSLLVVRLHSTFGLISRYEKYYHHPSAYMGHVSDMERYALKYADLVIGHIPAIGQRNQEHYGFDNNWLSRVHYEFPLIESGEVGEADRILDEAEPDFLFSSRLQPFKRSDLFVRAAVMFLEERPQYRGVFRLLCSGWDQDYISYVKSLVPSELASKIIFIDKVEKVRRDAIIGASIVVIPSDYESLCLFAFEAANAGARVVLNRRCEAFGSFDRWVEGKNCLMFDGTSDNLAVVLAEALEWRPSSQVNMSPDLPYWCKDEIEPHDSLINDAKPTELSVAVVRFGQESPAEVSRAIIDKQHQPISAARDVMAIRRSLVPIVEVATRRAHIELLPLSGAVMSSEELGRKLVRLKEELLLLCPKGYVPHRSFLRSAKAAFARNPDLMVFSSHVRCVHPVSGDVYDL